jgi:hypothetical protein
MNNESSFISRKYYNVSKEFVDSCPKLLGEEIILTGSVSRECADHYSDIEISFFADSFPSIIQRDKWLKKIGVEEVIHDETPSEDESIWSTIKYKGVWIEAGWHIKKHFDRLIERIGQGEYIDHDKLMMAWVIEHAKPLKTEGYLHKWKDNIRVFPSNLETKLVINAIETWRYPNTINSRWGLAYRNELVTLSNRFIKDIHTLLRILFSINNKWEPDWKWLNRHIHLLDIKPDNMQKRIDQIMNLYGNPPQSVEFCLDLILDTLYLISDQYDVTEQINVVLKSKRNVI